METQLTENRKASKKTNYEFCRKFLHTVFVILKFSIVNENLKYILSFS